METDNADKTAKGKYPHEGLTRIIVGALYNVYNTLGYGYREKEFQRAFEQELKNLGLNYKRELYCGLIYEGVLISKFFIDFLVDSKVVVELKVADDFYRKHFNQVMTYLKTNNIKVGLLAIFTRNEVLIKRVIN